MKYKIIITVLLLMFVSASIGYLAAKKVYLKQLAHAKSNSVDSAGNPMPDKYIRVVYFHAAKRCESCVNMQNYTEQTIKANFAQLIADRKLFYEALCVDEPQNAHYKEDFELPFNMVVAIEYEKGAIKRWQKFEQVWDHIKDEGKFKQYVLDEMKWFLTEEQEPEEAGE